MQAPKDLPGFAIKHIPIAEVCVPQLEPVTFAARVSVFTWRFKFLTRWIEKQKAKSRMECWICSFGKGQTLCPIHHEEATEYAAKHHVSLDDAALKLLTNAMERLDEAELKQLKAVNENYLKRL